MFDRFRQSISLVLIVLFILICIVKADNYTCFSNNIEVPKHRLKRYVLFTKSSKYFFRYNGKFNTLRYNTLIAFGFGSFRVNWDLPHNIPKRYQFFKRDIHEDIQSVTNEVTSMGISCLIKKMCEMFDQFRQSQKCEFFCEMGKIVMIEEGMEANFFKSIVNKCDHYRQLCPHDARQFISDLKYG